MVQDRVMTCPSPTTATQVLLTASKERGRGGQTLRPLFAACQWMSTLT